MNIVLKTVLKFFSLALPVACLALSVTLAIAAFYGSRETGAGAAQGDLGFFLVLVPASLIVLGAVGLTILMRRLLKKKSAISPGHARAISFLSRLSLLGIMGDWIMLAIWRN